MPRSKARRSADAALAKLYASLPRLECKGLCAASCGVIPVTQLESKILDEASGGVKLPDPFKTYGNGTCPSCPLLTTQGACSVYEHRPLICRLWGLVDAQYMRCPFGCRPTRYLSDEEARALLLKSIDISNRFQAAREAALAENS